MRVKGKVLSGGGEGAELIELPWVKKQIAEKLGFTPYPGTLNIKLTEGNTSPKKSLKKAKWIEISPPKGFCRGRCLKAYFMDNVECAIVIPEIESYLEGILEIVAPINLRKEFLLKNGDVVMVKIMLC